MDVRIESSAVLVAMVAIMLAFVVPGLLRGLSEGPHARRAAPDTTRRRSTMAPAAPPVARPAPLRIRHGRLGIALLGLAAALVFVVGGLLFLFGAVPGALPLISLLVFVGSFVALRVLAVRGRRLKALARMEAAFADAMSTPRPAAPAPRRQNEVFDLNPAPAPEPALTVEELRAAARRVADAAVKRTAVPTPWEPVDVPKPTYVDAAKADRPAPEPLPQPEEKKAHSVTSILQDTRARAAGEAEAASDVAPAALPATADSASRGGAPAATAQAPTGSAGAVPAAGGINLDAVLRRRRA